MKNAYRHGGRGRLAGLVHTRGQLPQHFSLPGQSASTEHSAIQIPMSSLGFGQVPGFSSGTGTTGSTKQHQLTGQYEIV